jgi:hypothetical protein
MELAAGPPTHWVVTIVGGEDIDIWADSVEGLSEKTVHLNHITFNVLMDIDLETQEHFRGDRADGPSGRRVSVATARFPRGIVQDIRGG